MDVKRFKEVFDTLDEEGQKNVISQLSDEELNAISSYKPESSTEASNEQNVASQISERFTDTSGLEQAIKNIPSSALNMAEGIYKAVTNPVQTATGLRMAFRGAVQKIPGVVNPDEENRQQAEAAANAIGNFYKDRYGGLENIRNTMVNDPVGFAADLSTVTGLGSKVAGMAGATNTADALSKVSRTVDPFVNAGKVYKNVVAPTVKSVAANVLGRSNSSGAPTMYKSMEAKPEFIKAMRDEVDDLYVVEKAQSAFGKMKEVRAATYRNQLKGIKSATQELDISDIKSLSDDWLDRFGVKKVGNELDFSRSTLSGSAVNDVKSIYDDIQQWGGKAGDKTPLMLDTLKRRISDFYTENGKARAMAADLSNAVQKKITAAVPEYGQMTKDYAKASDLIKSTEQAILSKNPKAVDTALRKIMMGVREEKGLRRSLMDDLSKYSDEDILALAAGRVSNPWFTRRLESSIVGTAGVIGGASLAPLMFALIPMSSPRLAAEASVMLGRTARAVEKVAKKIPRSSYLAAQQVGNINESINGNQVQQ